MSISTHFHCDSDTSFKASFVSSLGNRVIKVKGRKGNETNIWMTDEQARKFAETILAELAKAPTEEAA